MKKYDEIIGLQESFSPFYVLNNEREGYWKQFIPTQQFYILLESVLNSISSKVQAERKSFWLHGTYGTGKSHATGVIKKLLYAPLEEIEPYIERFKNRNDLKHNLINFRKNNRIFPVVMYGLSSITNQKDLILEIETSIRNALKVNGINIDIKTDFDEYIDNILSEKSNFWDCLIEDTIEISELVDNKDDLIKKLKNYDKEVLTVVRNELLKRNKTIITKDIIDWVKDVLITLQQKGIAEKIIIYWDEFTSVMDTGNTAILNQIQKIAELSETYDIFLYLISHRTQRQGVSRDDRKHLLGRFINIDYQMSDITTYHLISSYIKKKDSKSWEILRDKKNNHIEHLINKVSEFQDAEVKENVRDLFPIHPFTAYISSLIAREIGSTERSIFKFLNDNKGGFRYFINNYPDESRIFLTSEFVFDFYVKDFEEEGDPFYLSVFNRYKYDAEKIESRNHLYLPLFKGLLLLNIAHRILNIGIDNNDLVIPNEDNLKLMFLGSIFEKSVSDFLSFIHEQRIIITDYQNRYIVEANSLDISEINSSKRNLEKLYDKIEKIIDTEDSKKLLTSWMNNHRRKDVTEILLMDCDSDIHNIYRKINKFKKPYTFKIIAFVARDHTALSNVDNIIRNLDASIARNIIFTVIETLFTSEEYGEFIEHRARADVAHKRHLVEEEKNYIKNSEKVIERWINRVEETGFVNWYLFDVNNKLYYEKCRFKDFYSILNDDIAKIIFRSSFDIHYPRMNTLTAWQDTLAKKTAENYLTASSYDELLSLCKGPAGVALDILKDINGMLIVNEKLKIINTEKTIPLNIMINEISNRIKSGEELNLADVFSFLFEPPFGFYKCHVFLAATGFILRNYRNKLYHLTTGEIITDNMLKTMIESTFQYHCENNINLKKSLYFRLGSKDEKYLVKILQEIFGLQQCQSLTDTKHSLHDWIKTNLGFPLWLYNYYGIENEDVLLAIITINDKILSINSEHQTLNTTEIKQIYNEIAPVKHEIRKIVLNTDQDSKKSCFLSFFSTIEKIKYTEEDYSEIISFLERNLQEDVVFWSEQKVQDNVKDWYISKLQKDNYQDKSKEPDSQFTFNRYDEKIQYNGDYQIVKERDIVLKEIEVFHGDFTKVLSKLIDIRPDIIKDLRILLESEG